MKTHTVNSGAFQGDVFFVRIDALPDGVVEKKEPGPIVVAHSETGHHHEIAHGEARLFERIDRNPFVCYLSIDGEFADVVHQRPSDTHETIRLLRGCWAVKRQREHTPEGLRRVDD